MSRKITIIIEDSPPCHFPNIEDLEHYNLLEEQRADKKKKIDWAQALRNYEYIKKFYKK